MSEILLLRGPPGVGKTSLILKVIELLEKEKFNIGGMISQEVRENGVRTGFKIIDIKTGQEGMLASIYQKDGPRIGKYRVNLKDLENIGVKSISNALESVDLIVVDEIGPMEFFSTNFIEVVKQIAIKRKPMFGTVHSRSRHPIILFLENRAQIVSITLNNREMLVKSVMPILRKNLTSKSSQSL